MMTGIVIDKVRVSCIFLLYQKGLISGELVFGKLCDVFISHILLNSLFPYIYIYIYIAIQLLIRNNKKTRKYWNINRKKMPRVSLCNCLD
jgi:hypothetical protein